MYDIKSFFATKKPIHLTTLEDGRILGCCFVKAKKQKEATQEEQIKELTDKVDTLSNQIELLVKELVKNDKEVAKKVYKTKELPKGSHATRKRRGK